MWTLIFAAMAAASAVGILYLISRIWKLRVVRVISKGNGFLRLLISSMIIGIAVRIIWLAIGLMNTAIVIVHALVLWLLLDLIVRIVQRILHRTIRYDWVVLVGTLLLTAYFSRAWYDAHHIVMTPYQLSTDKLEKPLRIVQISDSHLGATFDGEGFAEAMLQVQQTEPDLVVVTGDFVDDDSSKEDMLRACEALGALKTTEGVYFVFGNHDKGYSNEVRGYDADDLIAALKAQQVRVLQDETVRLRDSISLIGRQDRSVEQLGGVRASMAELTEPLSPSDYQVVLDHQPNDFANQTASGVDLVLSGHTHGGQFFPINRLGEWTGQNDMTYGLRQIGDTTFEVSSGISDWLIPFKTGCKAEFVVIDVVPEPKTAA